MKAGDNIVLIGMPGVGKSTVGVLLAKALAREFVDTDIVIQTQTGRSLQEILDSEGTAAFRRIEEAAVLSVDCDLGVIATGGSVVYGDEAMAYLATIGTIVYLKISLETLKNRINDMRERGVLIEPGESLTTLYARRVPLYEKFAEETIRCDGLSHEEVVAAIIPQLGLKVGEQT